MTVEDIVKEWLTEHNYDGLMYYDGECSCTVDDLFPCRSEGALNCKAGYLHQKECKCSNCKDIDFTFDGEEVDSIMIDKPVAKVER